MTFSSKYVIKSLGHEKILRAKRASTDYISTARRYGRFERHHLESIRHIISNNDRTGTHLEGVREVKWLSFDKPAENEVDLGILLRTNTSMEIELR